MSKTRNDMVLKIKESSFLDFDHNLQNIIPTLANSEDDTVHAMSVLSRTCQTLHTFYRPSLLQIREMKAKKLLQFFMFADYDQAEKITKSYPTLMFIEVKIDVKQPGGIIKTEIISPLKFACKVYDIKLLRKCLEAVQNTQEPKLLACFIQQLNEPTNHIDLDLQPLFDAYGYYIQQCALWWNNQASVQQVRDSWLDVGKAQRYLPWSMLRIYLDKNSDWSEQSSFTTDNDLSDQNAEVIARYGDKNGEIESLNLAVLGSQAALVKETKDRGGVVNCAQNDNWYYTSITNDFATFRRLLAVRKADFEKFKLQLSKLSESVNNSPRYA